MNALGVQGYFSKLHVRMKMSDVSTLMVVSSWTVYFNMSLFTIQKYIYSPTYCTDIILPYSLGIVEILS